MDTAVQEVGKSFLHALPDEDGERRAWGLQAAVRRPELVARDLSWLIALTGPSVIVVDQIDTLIQPSAHGLKTDQAGRRGRAA